MLTIFGNCTKASVAGTQMGVGEEGMCELERAGLRRVHRTRAKMWTLFSVPRETNVGFPVH